MKLLVVERTETNDIQTTVFGDRGSTKTTHQSSGKRGERIRLLEALGRVFLPAGYPDTVSPDYLHYQIYNALQAFCSSLAGLLASRAVLEVFGVGDASATATHALLLTVFQDICSRLTTIVGAYYLGTALFPESKSYRLLADILNDAAITLDVLSPLLDSVTIPFKIPLIAPGSLPGLRVIAVCVSSALRALCGLCAGGSKAALSMHFATPLNGRGDLGELNAKDGSKETVLALSGMLLGTLIIPHVTTAWSTYTVLFLLLAGHLLANYIGIRGVVLRSLNRQRAGIIWTTRQRSDGHTDKLTLISPARVASMERIFERSGVLRDTPTNVVLGHCTIGSSLSSVVSGPISQDVLNIFTKERYIIWFDRRCLHYVPGRSSPVIKGFLRLHVCLKEGHTPLDQLKAWIHAIEVGKSYKRLPGPTSKEGDDTTALLRTTYATVDSIFADFVHCLRAARWDVDAGALLTGTPRSLLVSVQEADGISPTEKLGSEAKKDL